MPAAPRAASVWPSDLKDRAGQALQKLQTRAQFEAVLKGPILARTSHFALHGQPLSRPFLGDTGLSPEQTALGAMVPKRWARRAVTRNLLKRQIYGLAPALNPTPSPYAFVVRLRQSFPHQQFKAAASVPLKQAAREELLHLYAQARKAGG